MNVYIYWFLKSWVVRGSGLAHIIKKDRPSTRIILLPSSGWLPQWGLVMCRRAVWERYIHRPPYAKWRSLDSWSMEQQWSKSQWMQECNKCIIILSKMIGFQRGKKQPSSGWLPPCSLVVKKWAEAPQKIRSRRPPCPNLGKKSYLQSGNVPPYILVVGKEISPANKTPLKRE